MSMNVSVATDVTRTPDAPTLLGAIAALATLDTQETAAIAVVSEQSFYMHHKLCTRACHSSVLVDIPTTMLTSYRQGGKGY